MVAALYVQHAEELRRFLTGVLRDPELAAEALQNAFAKAIEQFDTVRSESLKSWLFRVGFHEALALRRRQAAGERALARHGAETRPDEPAPEDGLIRWESVQRVRTALDGLPPEQREVVRLRIYEEKTFAAIALETGRPLGTVLTRMQAALKKLREVLVSP